MTSSLRLSTVVFSIVIIALLSTNNAHAQNVKACIEEFTKQASAAPPSAGISSDEVEALVSKITSSIALDHSINVIPCSFTKKAVATYVDPSMNWNVPSGEYIIYDPTWIKEVIGSDKDQALVIFAHELGHLLNGDFTVRKDHNLLAKETAADSFAGCALARLDKDWDSVANVLTRLRDETTKNYPGRLESIEAAQRGFNGCGGKTTFDFIKYDGPPITYDVNKLKDDYPAGNWIAHTNGVQEYFEYQTSIMDNDTKLRFWRKNNATKAMYIEFVFNDSYRNVLSFSGARKIEGSRDIVNHSCGTAKDELIDALKDKLGGIKDKPIVKPNQDISGRYAELYGGCNANWNSTYRYSDCKKDATLTETDVYFKSTADVRFHAEIEESKLSAIRDLDGSSSSVWDLSCKMYILFRKPSAIR